MIRLLAVCGLLMLSASTALGAGEEHIGNEPLHAASYADWPQALPVINDTHRVYHTWVNGNEFFYFRGDTTALNAALKKFAAIKAQRRVVVLRPGPAETRSFDRKQAYPYNWNLHLLGGIAKHMSTLEFGSNVWDPNPNLNVYVGGPVKLEAISIPPGVDVLEIADLQVRYAKSLASSNQNVRGWSCGELARLNPYDTETMRKIATKLDDEADWVRLNAAGALKLFTRDSAEVIKKLKAVKTDDRPLQVRIAEAIDTLQEASPDDAARRQHDQQLAAIHAYVANLRKSP